MAHTGGEIETIPGACANANAREQMDKIAMADYFCQVRFL